MEIKTITEREMRILHFGKKSIRNVMFSSKHNDLSLKQRNKNARYIKEIRRDLSRLIKLKEEYCLICPM